MKPWLFIMVKTFNNGKKVKASAKKELNPRFGFGKNWLDFIEKNYSQERIDISKNKILGFLARKNLEGLSFLDIGCGSGLHSLAAWQAKASLIHSFDYDSESVNATSYLQKRAHAYQNWSIEQGSVLDEEYIKKLPKYDIVYSWGVLHHTGDVWGALRNAASLVKPGGTLFIALYSADVQINPSADFWLKIKRKYVESGWFVRFCMDWWYIWRFDLDKNVLNLPRIFKKIYTYKKERGMSFFTDIRDWLGGWPMEFVYDADVLRFCKNLGLHLEQIKTGGANTEFLFTQHRD